MKTFAFIPARAGSKRLPNKNRLILRGKPLIVYTIEAVIASGIFDEIFVSTDDDIISDITQNYKKISLHRRSHELAGDSATVTQVVLSFLSDRKNEFKVFGVFPPTSPFRKAHHIRESFQLLLEPVDSVISVSKYSFPPAFRMEIDDSKSITVPQSSPLLSGNTQVGNQKLFVHPNGAIYWSWVNSFLNYKSFYRGKICGYLMNRKDSIDIDDKFDMTIAEKMFDEHDE